MVITTSILTLFLKITFFNDCLIIPFVCNQKYYVDLTHSLHLHLLIIHQLHFDRLNDPVRSQCGSFRFRSMSRLAGLSTYLRYVVAWMAFFCCPIQRNIETIVPAFCVFDLDVPVPAHPNKKFPHAIYLFTLCVKKCNTAELCSSLTLLNLTEK